MRLNFKIVIALLFSVGCNYKFVHYSRVYYMEDGYLFMGSNPNKYYFYKSDVYFENDSCVKEIFNYKSSNLLKVFYSPLPLDFTFNKYFQCYLQNNEHLDTFYVTPVSIAYCVESNRLKSKNLTRLELKCSNIKVNFTKNKVISYIWINPK